MTARFVQKYLLVFACLWAVGVQAQEVSPLAYYTDSKGIAQESKSIDDGEAPLTVTFQANPKGIDGWIPSYEWHFVHTPVGESAREIFVRYEENTSYTFVESGTYKITLRTTLTNDSDMVTLDPDVVSVTIAESKLEFPNAFSPNGDGINDIYKAKDGYKSIVEFKAIILNRWGQKLYEWTDPAGGWNGQFHGHDVAQGVYFVLVKAKGADGIDYNIKKDVNLLRGYIKDGNTSKGK
jgi:gliding motility-associated-like protein